MQSDILRNIDTLDTAQLQRVLDKARAVLALRDPAPAPQSAQQPASAGSVSDKPNPFDLPVPGQGRHMGRPCPARAFAVPAEIKFLETVQLDALTKAFEVWRDGASQGTQRRSRTRVWLAYLLIRHAGLKLGEALGLDDRDDFDFGRKVVYIRETPLREVLLPDKVAREVRRLVEDPSSGLVPGEVFRLDPGYVRKKFYERGAEAAIPKELSTPSVVRHSYAIELLRSGVPLPVVQSILGHQSLALTANYVQFSNEDATRVVQHHFERRMRMKTSARNMFSGKVTAIRKGMILSEVELVTPSGNKVVSVITNDSMANLGLAEGSPVTATVKAPWVILVKDEDQFKTSARNKFHGKIVKINEGQIAAEVVVELPDGTKVCALVTDESVKSLSLKVGDELFVMFKAFSVILNVD